MTLDSIEPPDGAAGVTKSVGQRDLPGWSNMIALRERARSGRLDPAILAVMNEADPNWLGTTKEGRWKANIAALTAFSVREGHANVRAGHKEGTIALGMWVKKQRRDRAGGNLRQSRVDELSAFPGWTWDPQGTKFDGGLAVLDAYVACEGHSRVPDNHVEDGYPLGNWVTARRGQQPAPSGVGCRPP